MTASCIGYRVDRLLASLLIVVVAALVAVLAPVGTDLSAQSTPATVTSSGGLVDDGFIARSPGTNEGEVAIAVTVSDPNVTSIIVETSAAGGVVRRQERVVGAARPTNVVVSAAIPVAAMVHDVVVSTAVGNAATELTRWTNVVAGDVIVVQGQSNARATHGTLGITQSPFIRTFGSNELDPSASAADRTWHIAQPNGQGRIHRSGQVGKWGFELASQLLATYDTPIALFNGAQGGWPIDGFQRDDDNPADLDTNYGRLLQRLTSAGVAGDVRAVLWYQGEADLNDPASHRPGFESLVADWQTDLPGLEQIYLSQIHRGCTDTAAEDAAHLIVRYDQHQLALDRSDVTLLSTAAAPGHDGCHFDNAGYQELGQRAFRAVARDFYGGPHETTATPMAYFAQFNASRTEVDILFADGDDLITAQPGVEADFVLGDGTRTVTSVSSGNGRIRLTLSGPADPGASIAYRAWGPPWLVNSVGAGASAFQLPIAGSAAESSPLAQSSQLYSTQTAAPAVSCSVTRKGADIMIEWLAADADNSDAYVVRKSTNLSDFVRVATVDAPATSWIDVDGAADVSAYTVTSLNGIGSSTPTDCRIVDEYGIPEPNGNPSGQAEPVQPGAGNTDEVLGQTVEREGLAFTGAEPLPVLIDVGLICLGGMFLLAGSKRQERAAKRRVHNSGEASAQ